MELSQRVANIAADPAFQARIRVVLNRMALAKRNDPELAGLVAKVLRDEYSPGRIALALLSAIAVNPAEASKLNQSSPDNGVTDAMVEAVAGPMIPLLKQVLGA